MVSTDCCNNLYICVYICDNSPEMKMKKQKKLKHDKHKSSKKTDKSTITFVYILQSTTKHTKNYIGVTNNLNRRLRQHNGTLAGGARYTKNHRPWQFRAIFQMATRHDALSLEWRGKHRRLKLDGVGIDGKIKTVSRIGNLYPKCDRIL